MTLIPPDSAAVALPPANANTYRAAEIGAWDIQTRDNWGDDWVSDWYLGVRYFDETLQPAIPSAVLYALGGDDKGQSLGIGSVRPSWSTDYEVRASKSYVNKFVKIQFQLPEPTIFDEDAFTRDGHNLSGLRSFNVPFVGRIVSPTSSYVGLDVDGNPIGQQEMYVVGLESLLDQDLNQALAKDAVADTIQIQHVPPMNQRSRIGGTLLGNRTTAKVGNSHQYSASDNATWTHLDYVEYLIVLLNDFYFVNTGISFKLSGETDGLAAMETVQNFQGMTIRNVLNKLIPRKFGHSWRIKSVQTEDGAGNYDNTMYIEVVKLFSENITIGDTEITGNSNTLDLTTYQDSFRAEAKIIETAKRLYDLIWIVGEKIRVTGTWAIADSTLEKGWATADETAYKARFDGNAKAEVLPEHRDVWTKFSVPAAWNHELGDGEGGTADATNRQVLSDGTLTDQADSAAWNGQKRFLPLTSLRSGVDYTSATPTIDDDATFRPMMAFVKDAVASPALWLDVATANDYNKRFGNAVVGPDGESFAARVRFSPQHRLAYGQWTPTKMRHKTEVSIAYSTLAITASFDLDEPISVTEILEVESGNDITREKVIRVADARYDVLQPTTVIGVSDDRQSLVKSPAAYVALRDDTDKLRSLGALARTWYGTERRKCTFKYRELVEIGFLGQIVSELDTGHHSTEINTPITRILWQYPQGTNDTGSRTIYTDFIELDATAFGNATLRGHEVQDVEDLDFKLSMADAQMIQEISPGQIGI